MSSEDNRNKAQHGENAKLSLRKTIEELESMGAVSQCVHNPSYGYDSCEKDQFKAKEEIVLSDGEKMVLYSMSSVRSDRVKGLQWDASNIKAIDEEIRYAVIVIPDLSAFDQGTSVRDNIRSGNHFSAIDDILTTEELYDSLSSKHAAQLPYGIRQDLQGHKLEDLLARILSTESNLERFNGSQTATGFQYPQFEAIMNLLDIQKGSVLRIDATTKVPALPTGGRPKTDVAAHITMCSGECLTKTFSIKNTSEKTVSVHEYSADYYADVLDPTNPELRRLLNSFQTAGSKEGMPKADQQDLSMALRPYLRKLDMWVFGGYGAKGVTEEQCAEFLITRNKNTGEFSYHSIQDYIEILEAANSGTKGFGTIFSWTYASKKRGKCIQLKTKIL